MTAKKQELRDIEHLGSCIKPSCQLYKPKFMHRVFDGFYSEIVRAVFGDSTSGKSRASIYLNQGFKNSGFKNFGF